MSDILVTRNSELSTYRECRQEWQWAYLDRLSIRKPKSALLFGNMIHDVLERFYIPGIKRGGKPPQLWQDVWAEYEADGGEDWEIGQHSAYELGYVMCLEYWKEYGLDKKFKIIAPEQTFQVDIHHYETGEFLGVFTGTMDAVVLNRDTGKKGLFEHKTGATLDPFGAPLQMDEQAGTYWTLGPIYLKHTGVLAEDDDLDFVLYNRLRKAMPDQRERNEEGHYLNKNGTVSKNQPPPLFKREYTWRTQEDRQSLYRRICDQMVEMQMVKEGGLSVYKNPGKHCGFCQFRDMCEVHEIQSDWESVRDATMTVWDPYGDHSDHIGETE